MTLRARRLLWPPGAVSYGMPDQDYSRKTRSRDEDREAFAAMKAATRVMQSLPSRLRSNASTWIAVDRMRYLNVASVFHHVQPINHLAPLVPVYLAQDRQSFLNLLIDL